MTPTMFLFFYVNTLYTFSVSLGTCGKLKGLQFFASSMDIFWCICQKSIFPSPESLITVICFKGKAMQSVSLRIERPSGLYTDYSDASPMWKSWNYLKDMGSLERFCWSHPHPSDLRERQQVFCESSSRNMREVMSMMSHQQEIEALTFKVGRVPIMFATPLCSPNLPGTMVCARNSSSWRGIDRHIPGNCWPVNLP